MVGLKQRSCVPSLVFLLVLVSNQGSLASFWKDFCSKNPSALPGLCRNVQGCPVTNWGEWQLQSFSPSNVSNVSCPSAGRLLRFTRTRNISYDQSSVTCTNGAGKGIETQDRCKSRSMRSTDAY